MKAANTDEIVRALADKEAIRDLARRYADCVWRGDAAGAADLFAENGEMDTGDGPTIRGRAALRAEYETMLAGKALLPFVHDHLVDLAGDEATGVCHLDLRATMNGRSMIGAGWYDDRYVREHGAWKFQARRLTLAWFVPLHDGWAGPASGG